MVKRKKNTVFKTLFIVFFFVFILALLLFNIYAKNMHKSIITFTNEKIDKVVYQFFSDLITDDIINKETVNNILEINKNNKDEIIAVNYDLEKTYRILTKISNVLKESLSNLENGQIDVTIYDKYLESSSNGLVLNVPLFLNSKNVFANNLGPKIPIVINFNENLLTNVKTKVTSYGFNNALLEVYVTVQIKKLIISPLKEENDILKYDILISSLVINGSVPEFYGDNFEALSGLL